jgi:hypothetical protein
MAYIPQLLKTSRLEVAGARTRSFFFFYIASQIDGNRLTKKKVLEAAWEHVTPKKKRWLELSGNDITHIKCSLR